MYSRNHLIRTFELRQRNVSNGRNKTNHFFIISSLAFNKQKNNKNNLRSRPITGVEPKKAPQPPKSHLFGNGQKKSKSQK